MIGVEKSDSKFTSSSKSSSIESEWHILYIISNTYRVLPYSGSRSYIKTSGTNVVSDATVDGQIQYVSSSERENRIS